MTVHYWKKNYWAFCFSAQGLVNYIKEWENTRDNRILLLSPSNAQLHTEQIQLVYYVSSTIIYLGYLETKLVWISNKKRYRLWTFLWRISEKAGLEIEHEEDTQEIRAARDGWQGNRNNVEDVVVLLEHLPGKETEDVIDMESFPGLCDRWSVVSPWTFSEGGHQLHYFESMSHLFYQLFLTWLFWRSLRVGGEQFYSNKEYFTLLKR